MVALPVLFMVALVPLVQNDVLLTVIYIVIITVSSIRYQRKDFIFLLFGCIVFFFSEYLFISTGVETFERRSLFGVMPLWLPLLWAYVFVAMKRGVLLFEKYLR